MSSLGGNSRSGAGELAPVASCSNRRKGEAGLVVGSTPNEAVGNSLFGSIRYAPLRTAGAVTPGRARGPAEPL